MLRANPPTRRHRTSDGAQQHYDWLTGYLAVRGWANRVRTMLALVSLAMTVCLCALLISADGPRGTLPVAMMSLGIAGGTFCVALWLRRWPTRRQSIVYAVIVTGSTALACHAYPEPLASLVGCIAFATAGAYAAFFHTWRLIAFNFVVALAVAVTAAARIAVDGHVALALTDLFLVLQINALMPAAILILVRTLGGDLVEADRDPLTGLLNRRAFRDKMLGLLNARSANEDRLLVAVIDLDDFKSINDTHGHLAGDEVLMHAAGALLAAAPHAIVARSGGEEFVVACLAEAGHHHELGDTLCRSVAEACRNTDVTASVGVVRRTVRDVEDADLMYLIDELSAAADAVMYRAKRAGGNQCQQIDL